MDFPATWLPALILSGAMLLTLLLSMILAIVSRRFQGFLFWLGGVLSIIIWSLIIVAAIFLATHFDVHCRNVCFYFGLLPGAGPFYAMTYEGQRQKSRKLFWAGIFGVLSLLLFLAFLFALTHLTQGV